MKYIYLISTVLLLLLCLRVIKLLDNPFAIIAVFILTALLGLLIKKNGKENKAGQDLGWGLLYGGLSAFILILVFMVWLSFNFPK